MIHHCSLPASERARLAPFVLAFHYRLSSKSIIQGFLENLERTQRASLISFAFSFLRI